MAAAGSEPLSPRIGEAPRFQQKMSCYKCGKTAPTAAQKWWRQAATVEKVKFYWSCSCGRWTYYPEKSAAAAAKAMPRGGQENTPHPQSEEELQHVDHRRSEDAEEADERKGKPRQQSPPLWEREDHHDMTSGCTTCRCRTSHLLPFRICLSLLEVVKLR